MPLPLIFLFLTIFSVQAGPVLKQCNDAQSLVALRVCTPLIVQLKANIDRHKLVTPTVEQFKNISTLCQATTHCLGDLKCQEAEESRAVLVASCELLDIKTCWPKFYKAVQTNKYACTKKYGFVDPDLSKQKTALTTGKSCVLQVIHNECPKNFFDHLNNSINYDKLVKVVTTRPNNNKCIGIHFDLQAMQCTYSLEQFKTDNLAVSKEVRKLKAGGGLNARVVSLARQQCRVAKDCISRHCDSNHAENLAKMEGTCKAIENIENDFRRIPRLAN